MKIVIKPIYIISISILVLFLVQLTSISTSQAQQQLRAFPGAEGFGAYATGGRGGNVYIVTNLNDSGTGSFRDAVSKPNRYIVFAVGGVIRISSRIVVSPDVTIAGQTAPGEGITIYGNGLSYSNANNSITRYIRIRMGKVGTSGADALGIASGSNMIFDHVSVTWGKDETFSISGTVNNVTIQDSIIGQGLVSHSAGGLIQTDGGVTILRSLYIDNQTRNPKVKGVSEFVNNIIYNWGDGGGYILGDSAGQSYCNVIENYFIAGPSTAIQPFTRGNLNFHIYAQNNFYDSNLNGILDGAIVPNEGYTTVDFQPSPYPYPSLQYLSANNAYKHVIANAGASKVRDSIDKRLIEEVTSLGRLGQLISDETATPMNGPGSIAGGIPPLDSDSDGMPNYWETAAGSDPNTQDHNGDVDGNGYKNIEDYINSLAPAGLQNAALTGISEDTGRSTTDGITKDNSIIITGNASPGNHVTISKLGIGILGSVTSDSEGHWSFDYSTTSLLEGQHIFFASAADLIGRPDLPSPAFTVTVDQLPPDAPAISSVLNGSELVISGRAEPYNEIEVSISTLGVAGRTITDNNGIWSFTYTGGGISSTASFTAVATDIAGNRGASSIAYLVNPVISSPTIASIDIDAGISAIDKITNDSTLVLQGTGASGQTIRLEIIGVGAIGVTTVDPNGVWSFDYTSIALLSGQYAFVATAISEWGENSYASPPFTVVIDTIKPNIASITRFNPDRPATSVSAVVYRINFTEQVIGVDLNDFNITFTGSSTASLEAVTPAGTSSFDVRITGVEGEGTLRLDVKSSGTGIIDIAGNSIAGGFTSGQIYTIRAQGSGVWINSETGGIWSDSLNWEDQAIAEGLSATADFSILDIVENNSVTLNSSKTLGHMIFGDTDTSTAASWMIASEAENYVTLDAGTNVPTITVNTMGEGGAANLNIGLVSANGLRKLGAGSLVLTKPNQITGPLTVGLGTLRLDTGSSLSVTDVLVSNNLTWLHINGGTFMASGLTTIAPRNGFIYIDSGEAHFDGGVTARNTRDPFFRVRGGKVTASYIDFPRTNDGFPTYSSGLLIQGGETKIGYVSLGTNNSWGAMSVEDGSLIIDGPLTVGYQVTSGRGGAFRVTGGTLRVNDKDFGIVLARNPGTNPNNVTHANFLGGASFIEKITMGYDVTVTGGSANLLLNGGELYLGSGGIVKNGTGSFATNITLSNGILGAIDNWSTDLNMQLTESNVLTIKNSNGFNPFHRQRNITLNGILSGPGGFTKSGSGRLFLNGENTFTGPVTVNEGVLEVNGLVSTGGAFSITGSGILTGGGIIDREVLINEGGKFTFDLASGKTLTIKGALTNASEGPMHIFLNASSPLTVGETYTLVTYQSTNLTLRDIKVIGLHRYKGKIFVENNAVKFQVTCVDNHR